MKRIITCMAALFCTFALQAAGPRFSYGLEWGYTATFLKTWQNNFICEEGYRIVDKDREWRYFSNGAILACAGADLTHNLNLSVYSGLEGVYSHRWMIPVELRARLCPRGLDRDGMVYHLGGAVAFPLSNPIDAGAQITAGAGRRFAVYKNISVDFLLSFQLTVDHSQIKDPDSGNFITPQSITSNTSEYCGIRISAALNF